MASSAGSHCRFREAVRHFIAEGAFTSQRHFPRVCRDPATRRPPGHWVVLEGYCHGHVTQPRSDAPHTTQQNENENEGEGNHTAAREFNKAQGFQPAKKGKVKPAAEDAAAAVDRPEGKELRQAEELGRRHSPRRGPGQEAALDGRLRHSVSGGGVGWGLISPVAAGAHHRPRPHQACRATHDRPRRCRPRIIGTDIIGPDITALVSSSPGNAASASCHGHHRFCTRCRLPCVGAVGWLGQLGQRPSESESVAAF